MPKEITTKENSHKKVNKILSGVVVSNKMQKTIVVSVTRFVKHPKYGKYYKISKKYKAHDEHNKLNIGDKVFLQETKPMSKDKKFMVVEN